MHEETAKLFTDAAQSFRPLAEEPNPFDPHGSWAGGADQLPLEEFLNEAQLTERIFERLNPWFEIKSQVRGRHYSGRGCRIDAIITPRDPLAWKSPDIAIGIEFKRSAGGNRKDRTAFVAQSIDYAYVEWQDFGRVPVFMCPNPFPTRQTKRDPYDPLGAFVDGLLGQFNIGYVILYRGYGLAFVLQGTHRIWSERRGVEEGRRWNFSKPPGSR